MNLPAHHDNVPLTPLRDAPVLNMDDIPLLRSEIYRRNSTGFPRSRVKMLFTDDESYEVASPSKMNFEVEELMEDINEKAHSGSGSKSNRKQSNEENQQQRKQQQHRLSKQKAKSSKMRRRRRRTEKSGNSNTDDASSETFTFRGMKNGTNDSSSRNLWWFSGSKSGAVNLKNYDPYNERSYLADTGNEYDMWQQAYRMLGPFIDCDDGGGEDRRSRRRTRDREDESLFNENERNSQHRREDSGDGDYGCKRWMMWAAYVNPSYEGGEYGEYYTNDDYGGTARTSALDCHNADSEWELLGVYKMEFYQFIEQMIKHVWAYDDWEYIAASAALNYMGEDDCQAVGYTDQGYVVYAGIMPLSSGSFQMGLYTDEKCIVPDTTSGNTYDDFYGGSNYHYNGEDGDDQVIDDDAMLETASAWWEDSQEYTLSNINTIFDNFKKCTTCIDYPTYQDGYFIGDDGTDEDDLINQCWKFYSHDSFSCGGDCVALASRQGTVQNLTFAESSFGHYETYTPATATTTKNSSSSTKDNLFANLFTIVALLAFLATSTAFLSARDDMKKAENQSTGNKKSKSGHRSNPTSSFTEGAKEELLIGDTSTLGQSESNLDMDDTYSPVAITTSSKRSMRGKDRDVDDTFSPVAITTSSKRSMRKKDRVRDSDYAMGRSSSRLSVNRDRDRDHAENNNSNMGKTAGRRTVQSDEYWNMQDTVMDDSYNATSSPRSTTGSKGSKPRRKNSNGGGDYFTDDAASNRKKTRSRSTKGSSKNETDVSSRKSKSGSKKKKKSTSKKKKAEHEDYLT
mmetsp:Transcript_36975/g.43013  ORF Transcript_36975/g.43013 Transcript_36975/m.43013 type:complete len:795 (+) Transcript_36975:37-2421(+)